MTPILEVKNAVKKYGDFEALKDISMSVGRGETRAIIGPNGAGKTTLFKVITGETLATSGTIRLAGRDVSKASADERVRMGMGRTFQIVRVFNDYTPAQNLQAAIEARHRQRRGLKGVLSIRPDRDVRDEAQYLLGRVGLDALRDTPARHLALGDRKRLEFALTLALQPLILMLDEPTAGMSHLERLAILELIESSRAEMGLTIVLTEHDIDFVFRLATSLMVMNFGETVFSGTPQEARESALVQQVYLGKEGAHA